MQTHQASTRLREVRRAIGVSQAELSRRTGPDASIISRVERAEIRSWPKFRREVSAALGVPEELLFGDRQP